MSNTSNAPSPARVLGDLADENRLRVLAAVVLGEARIARIAERASLTEEEVARALGHLLRVGIVAQDENGLHVATSVFADAARTVSVPRVKPDLGDATPEQAAVLQNFVGGDGRVALLLTRAAKRKLVLEYVSNRFEPKREYGEREVNAVLEEVHDDYVTLRRYLSSTRACSSGAPVSTGGRAPRPPSDAPTLSPRGAGSSVGRAGDF
jgi:hypothetical protein